jgi:hypothetical protein
MDPINSYLAIRQIEDKVVALGKNGKLSSWNFYSGKKCRAQ